MLTKWHKFDVLLRRFAAAVVIVALVCLSMIGRAAAQDRNPAQEHCQPSPARDARRMPNLVGCTFHQAAKVVGSNNHPDGSRREVPSDRPAGEVIQQWPRRDAVLEPHTRFTVYVSDGSGARSRTPDDPQPYRPVPMPNLIGQSEREAYNTLEQYHLPRPDFHPGYSERPRGQVYDQQPEPGSDARRVRGVDVFVSEGPRESPPPPPRRVTMPDLRGMLYLDAVETLVEQRLPKPSPTHQYSRWPLGQVFEQDPAPHTDMTGKTHVDLVVSDGPPPAEPLIAVPDVVGKSRYDASDALTNTPLRPMFRSEEPNPGSAGTVTRTDPPAGSRIVRGAEVSYWVASGNNVVPSVHWKTLDAASDALETAGFRLGRTTPSSDYEKPGLVLKQDPLAGTVAPVNTTVNVVVSEKRATADVSHPPPDGTHGDGAGPAPNNTGPASSTATNDSQASGSTATTGRTQSSNSKPTPDEALHKLKMIFAGTSGAFVLVAGAGMTFWQRAQRIKVTRSLLRIRPSFDRNAVDATVAPLPQVAASVRLAAHLEIGAVQSDAPLPIIRKEIRHA